MPDKHHLELVQSYTRVRLALGLLGLALPLILIIGGIYDTPRVGADPRIEPTISDFYHTTYRDIFVGSLCAIGVFLISYRGYRREKGEWINDDWLATIAGLAAFGLAFFPNEGGGNTIVSALQRMVGVQLAPVLHYSFALVFFLALAGFCFFKFPKSAKSWRNKFYIRCGQGIMLALVLTAIAVIFKRWIGGPIGAFVEDYSLIFFFEAMGVWAFAASWIVKSRADMSLARKLSLKRFSADEQNPPEDDAPDPPP
jgi:hypothetical protein